MKKKGNSTEIEVDLEHYHAHTHIQKHTFRKSWLDLNGEVTLDTRGKQQDLGTPIKNDSIKLLILSVRVGSTSITQCKHTHTHNEIMETASEKSLEPQWTDTKEIKETHIPPKFIILSV